MRFKQIHNFPKLPPLEIYALKRVAGLRCNLFHEFADECARVCNNTDQPAVVFLTWRCWCVSIDAYYEAISFCCSA